MLRAGCISPGTLCLCRARSTRDAWFFQAFPTHMRLLHAIYAAFAGRQTHYRALLLACVSCRSGAAVLRALELRHGWTAKADVRRFLNFTMGAAHTGLTPRCILDGCAVYRDVVQRTWTTPARGTVELFVPFSWLHAGYVCGALTRGLPTRYPGRRAAVKTITSGDAAGAAPTLRLHILRYCAYSAARRRTPTLLSPAAAYMALLYRANTKFSRAAVPPFRFLCATTLAADVRRMGRDATTAIYANAACDTCGTRNSALF